MFARLVASTIFAAALTQGAAFAQSDSQSYNPEPSAAQSSEQSSAAALNAQSNATEENQGTSVREQNEQANGESSAAANEQANTAEENQESAATEAHEQANAAPSNQSASAEQRPLPQQIRSKMQNMGFSDVQVVPGSYIVTARDKDGDPVTMIIGPHSTTLFTIASADNGQQNQAQ